MYPFFTADSKVWVTAALQIAYSLGTGSAELSTLASYNHPEHNAFRWVALGCRR